MEILTNPISRAEARHNIFAERAFARALKDALDFMGALAMLIVLSPLLLVIALAVKLDDGVLRFLVVVREGEQPVPVPAAKSDEEDDE